VSGKSEDNKKQNQKEWDKLEQAREKVIHSIAQNMDLYGITASIGRLYGTMFFQHQPMTLDEMGTALGMSKTSMSTGVRSLLEINMVQRTWIKGVRKDLYTVEEDWYKTFIDLFTTKWRKGIEMNEEEINEASQDLVAIAHSTEDEELKLVIEQDLEKLRHAVEYYHWLERLVKCFESGEIFKFIPKTDKTK
jgi:DNA-binding transcriptional regulator GbsR (MarR family)